MLTWPLIVHITTSLQRVLVDTDLEIWRVLFEYRNTRYISDRTMTQGHLDPYNRRKPSRLAKCLSVVETELHPSTPSFRLTQLGRRSPLLCIRAKNSRLTYSSNSVVKIIVNTAQAVETTLSLKLNKASTRVIS